MSQSTSIDHFQSVPFHLWINHLSFGPKFFKEINSQKNNIQYMITKRMGVRNPALTFIHPKFLFHLYFNSLHPLVSESPSVPGTALEMLENCFQAREEAFKQTTLYLFRKEKAVLFLCVHQFPYR